MADRAEKHATGFAGLVSLASDVQGVIREAERSTAEQIRANQTVAASKAGRASATSETAAPRRATPQQQPVSQTTFRWGRLAVIGTLVGLGALITLDPKDSSSPPAVLSPAPATGVGVGTSGFTPVPDILDERRPVPGGGDRVLDMAEIRYCLAEQIRISAAEAVVNDYSDTEVDRFNAYVDDYNLRCGRYHYRSGAVERARADVERHRAALEAEGRARFRPGTSSRPPGEQAPFAVRNGASARATSARGGESSASQDTQEDLARRIRERRPELQREAELRAAGGNRRSDREQENLATCLSGEYPVLCNHSLLTTEERTQVAAAERSANYRTCISGEYPVLCKHSLLTSSEAAEVATAERRANYRTCSSGVYPVLCKHHMLTAEQAVVVREAERRANYRTCISGLYSSLCNHSLLTSEEAKLVAAAERRARRP